jgi:4-diphosphocytidyl-2-C-methyl-D-erythritol kinase
MPVSVRSFAKINLGLHIGARREDGFHDLLTVYQTLALHDVIRVSLARGGGIEVRCDNPGVPQDESNTCSRIVKKVMQLLRVKDRVIVDIQKRLPVQGGLGGASSNAVSALLGLERLLGKPLPGQERLRIAAEVGSDLPLFLIGGTVLGVGRGEQVSPLEDLPATACVVVTPQIGISTPKAFEEWDQRMAQELTLPTPSDRMGKLGRGISAWLSGRYSGAPRSGRRKRRGRAGNPLLELVRTGIKNDFEQVVFSEYPELSEVKCALECAGARYASLSGSGSALYGLFASRQEASAAAEKLRKQGWTAQATVTLTRRQYWSRIFD